MENLKCNSCGKDLKITNDNRQINCTCGEVWALEKSDFTDEKNVNLFSVKSKKTEILKEKKTKKLPSKRKPYQIKREMAKLEIKKSRIPLEPQINNRKYYDTYEELLDFKKGILAVFVCFLGYYSITKVPPVLLLLLPIIIFLSALLIEIIIDFFFITIRGLKPKITDENQKKINLERIEEIDKEILKLKDELRKKY